MDSLAQWLPIIAALMLTGVIAGLLAGLIGVGGGIVIVPVLFFVFQWLGISAATAMSVATGTSLLIIVATSLSSVRAHHRRGNVDTELLRSWAPFVALGVMGGVLLATRGGGVLASGIFGAVALLVAINMLLRADAKILAESLPGRLIQRGIAAVIGLLSSVMGIGAGTLGVPVLTAFNTPAHRAVGTAAALGFVIALPGALLMLLLANTPADAPEATFGFINLPGFALIVPLSVVMAPVGVWLGSRLDGAALKRVFAVFLLFSGTRMIYQAAIA
ncbi:sulfite exporter TauE/SafE family protein [Microbulbifer rhizosphaerae]|uniref:Probable membrane transporter protein n=1 Tax=Microbulbifer rhizosphaerae TaxID=1562603 RepID=A0A7W4WET4_9GAMM|nr:sulfite exporter TauE/SafE family protein [Microbulbifer rhizosphaerae]MBB3062881.1 putative membrane protein YfcA [Microbulbifer rhizosphaerae]